METIDRLLPRIDAAGPCWLWTAARMSRGYGAIKIAGRFHLTHRLMWQSLVGPIPAGLELDHLCRVKACCNPDHLEPVTHQENLSRSRFRARPLTCSRGHLFTPENTRRAADGTRHCRTCTAAYLARRKAQAA